LNDAIIRSIHLALPWLLNLFGGKKKRRAIANRVFENVPAHTGLGDVQVAANLNDHGEHECPGNGGRGEIPAGNTAILAIGQQIKIDFVFVSCNSPRK
jgi:hypothetical protein